MEREGHPRARPWLRSADRTTLTSNDDVLEVIAEYACGTVADACALRGSCKGYRRAVDTTVRRLVYEDQPELRAGELSSETPLRLYRDSGGLDVVFIAFSSDAASRIAKLVVVAFALDGAKDELYEGEQCGPRPVAASDWSAFTQPSAASDAPMRVVLQRCMTHAFVRHYTDGFSAEHAATVEALAASWPLLTELRWFDLPEAQEFDRSHVKPSQTEGLGRLCRLLRAVGPQLHALHIEIGVTSATQMIEELCPAVAGCGNLKSFELNNLADDVSGPLCDALLASGAPLEDIAIDELARDDAVRLIEATETIHTAHVWALDPTHLSPRALGRMRKLSRREIPNGSTVFPLVRTWRASPYVTTIELASVLRLLPPPSLGFPDFAAVYPNLKQLFVQHETVFDLSRARFPTSLEEIRVRVSAEAGNAFLRQLAAAHGGGGGSAGLPNLRKVDLNVTDHPALVDPSPLVAFSGSLRTLRVVPLQWQPDQTPLSGAPLQVLESALSQLTGLVIVTVQGLPTARCFAGGQHKRLRELSLGEDGRIHAPDAGMPIGALFRACPRLIEAQGRRMQEPFELPVGCQLVEEVRNVTCVRRSSFV